MQDENRLEVETPDFEPSTVFAKILDVMAEIKSIEKDGFNDYQGFKFAKIDTIMQKFQPAFVKAKLAVITDILDETFDGNMATVSMLVTFIDTENPNDRFTTRWVGTGTDKSDKAVPKAISAAYKACLLKTFCVGAGEVDADADAQEREVRKLDEHQVREVYELLEDKGLDAAPIVSAYGVATISDIPSHQFERIKRSIVAAKPSKASS